MKKRVLSLLLCIMLVVGMVPTTAFAGVTDTWAVELVVSKNSAVQYNGQDTVEIGFAVQSDNLKLKNLQSLMFAFDFTLFDFINKTGSKLATCPVEQFTKPVIKNFTYSAYSFYSDIQGDTVDWKVDAYHSKSADDKFGYVMIQPSQDSDDCNAASRIILGSVLLGFKSGKSFDDLTNSSIRLANATEVHTFNQSSAVMVTDGDTNTQNAVLADGGTDTLKVTPKIVWNGITPAEPPKPAYSGTIDAPTVKTNAGGKVELYAVTPTGGPGGETVQYGYSKTNDGKNITWQDGTTFSGLTVSSTLYFYAKVVETPSYAEKVSDASAAVTVLDKVLTNLEITAQPTTKTYTHGDPFKTDGMKVKATYSDGSINADFTGYTVAYQTSGKGYLCKDNTKVTLKAGDKSVEVTGLTVNAKALTVTGITATNRPYAKDNLEVALTGGTVSGVVSGDTVTVDLTNAKGTMTDANAGNGKAVTVTGVALGGANKGNYTLTQPTGIKVNITQKNISGATITLGTQATYNGSEQGVVISKVTVDGTDLTAGSDYTITSGDKATNVEEKTLKITGNGNYTGEASATWSLVAKDIGDASVSITFTPTSYGYTGSAINPSYTVKDNSRTLTVNNDYTANISDNTYVGTNTAKLTITGTGNYTGTKSANFTITAVDQNPTFTTPKGLVKGGHKLDLRTLVQDAKGQMSFTISGVTSTYAVLESDGYTLTSTVLPGTVKINVNITTKDENNDGTSEYNAFNKDNAITVNVVDKTINTTTMKVLQGDITYGESVSPSVSGQPAGTGTVRYTYEGRDGTTYSNSAAPTNVGKYKVKATCESSTTIYTAEDDFEILPKSISGMTVTLNKTSLEYNGSAQAVNVTVKNGTTTLTKDTDYTVTGTTSSTNVGNYTVTVTGKGNYTDSVDRTWKITQGTPTYTAPTGLTATFGQTLANVNIAATTGWSWMDSTQPVGDASTTPKTFKAKFTPADTTNYKTVENIDVSVTVGKKTAPTLADIPVSQKYTTTTGAKAIGTVMPADAGTLTYAPSTASKTGSVTIDSWAVDSTGKVTYTLSGGAAGDTVTLPVIIKSTNYADATVKVVITLTAKDNQAALTLTGGTTVVYGETLQLGTSGGNGTGTVTYTVINDTGEATIDSNGILTPVEVGTVKVKATKAEDANYNAITSAEKVITITRATPTGTPFFTKITEKDKTLANAALGIGTLTPAGGSIKWVDDLDNVLAGDTKVEANKAYKWKYTPADTINYAPVYGTIVVYPVSTGIVIYSPCYTIKASAGVNGSISPAGWCSVVENGSQTFTFTPDKGYTVAKVLVDGKSVGAVKSYTFKDVTKDHTIEVIFMKSNGNPATGVFVMP